MTLTARELKPGFSFPPVTMELSPEEVITNGKGWALWMPDVEENIHTNEEIARSEGMRSVVAPGIMNMAVFWEMFLNAFGESWLRDGKLAATFTNVVCGGDKLTANAVVREPAEGEPTDRLHIDLWMDNQEDEKVMVGKASVPLQ